MNIGRKIEEFFFPCAKRLNKVMAVQKSVSEAATLKVEKHGTRILELIDINKDRPHVSTGKVPLAH